MGDFFIYLCGNQTYLTMARFYLKNPSANKSAIFIFVSIKGTQYRKSTGISIEPRFWNKEKEVVRDVKDFPTATKVNKRLREIKAMVEAISAEVQATPTLPDQDQFWNKVFSQLDGVLPRQKIYFTDYMQEFIERRRMTVAANTTKQYITALNRLKDFEKYSHKRLGFIDINLAFYERLKRWHLGNGFNLNSLAAIVKSIKVVYRDAREVDELHDLHETEKRGFTSSNYVASTIYLSTEELQRIAEVEITEETLLSTFPELVTGDNSQRPNARRKAEALRASRNKFLLGAYTALRVSDFNHLRDVHISGDYFRIKTQKTGAVVVIPIHPVIRKMLNEGFDISQPIADQKLNKHIKYVARLAGITQLVEGTKLIGHRAVVGWYPKCDLITTHTARRSAATNMYKAGIPSISIMRITGHTTERSFMKYIKISAEENAEMMAKNAFFGG